ncbi:hypothetical protein [Conexibacter sp. CPCC 206217]|uniref:hypothetical protein n=1 Tax=Conexibacter sp. CPCC 206217 TaxID=3064574 RepID=UPI00271ADE86|nr:hypothetical protein [Conexibacter sp. CPCC 206217]MDO8209648.1 hypothetical protein [Conexibacter sp. CPCC 206217]
MLEIEQAVTYLQRLAAPTLEAFGEARVLYGTLQETLEPVRFRLSRQVGGVIDGVTYWGLFATCLVERFARVEGVARALETHPLAHHWVIEEQVTVQLKSDTGNLPLDQLVLPGMREVRGIARELVVLTWDHDHVDRFDPTFVQMDGKREAWRVPVAALLDEQVAAIEPVTPKATVTSPRTGVASNEDETNEQS